MLCKRDETKTDGDGKIMSSLEEQWVECCSEESIRCSPDYWNGRADDYADFIVNSDYIHGRNILRLFEAEKIISQESSVLDIASGPGAITIPFAEKVKSVTSVEPASNMAKKLEEAARAKNLNNISIIPDVWQNVSIQSLQKYDLVISCHSIWHFPDLINHITRMEEVSKGYCCIAHGITPLENESASLYNLKIADTIDRFYLVKQILDEKGLFPEVSVQKNKTRRTIQSARSMLTLELKKYREPNADDYDAIEKEIARCSSSGMYEKTNYMGVLWWRLK